MGTISPVDLFYKRKIIPTPWAIVLDEDDAPSDVDKKYIELRTEFWQSRVSKIPYQYLNRINLPESTEELRRRQAGFFKTDTMLYTSQMKESLTKINNMFFNPNNVQSNSVNITDLIQRSESLFFTPGNVQNLEMNNVYNKEIHPTLADMFGGEYMSKSQGKDMIKSNMSIEEIQRNIGDLSRQISNFQKLLQGNKMTYDSKIIQNSIDRLTTIVQDLEKAAANGGSGDASGILNSVLSKNNSSYGDIIGLSNKLKGAILEQTFRLIGERMKNVPFITLNMGEKVYNSKGKLTHYDAALVTGTEPAFSGKFLESCTINENGEINEKWSNFSNLTAEQVSQLLNGKESITEVKLNFGNLENDSEQLANNYNMLLVQAKSGFNQKAWNVGKNGIDFNLNQSLKDYYNIMDADKYVSNLSLLAALYNETSDQVSEDTRRHRKFQYKMRRYGKLYNTLFAYAMSRWLNIILSKQHAQLVLTRYGFITFGEYIYGQLLGHIQVGNYTENVPPRVFYPRNAIDLSNWGKKISVQFSGHQTFGALQSSIGHRSES